MSQSFRLPGFAALPKRPAHIKVTKDGAEVDSVAVADKALLFGRKVNHAPKLGTYRLDHDSISREHAAVVHSFDGSWFIMDVGSRFGTHVNGERLEAKKYVPLAEGAQIKFGESTRSFTFSLRAPAAAAPPPRAASPPPARKKAAAPPPPPPPKPKSSGGPAGIDDDLVDPMANYVDRADDDDDDDDDEGEEGGRGEAGTRRGKEGRPSKEERREQKRREKERRKAVKKELKKEAKRAEKKEKKGKKEKKEKKEKRDKEAKRPKRDREEAEGGDGAAEQPAGAEEAPTPPRAGEGRAAGSDSDSDSGRSDGSVDDAREAADEARRKRAREASAADWNSSRRL